MAVLMAVPPVKSQIILIFDFGGGGGIDDDLLQRRMVTTQLEGVLWYIF